MNEITQLINSMGFPIACCVGLGWFIYTNNKNNREDNIRRETKLMEQMGEISATNKLLVETNAEIANKLDIKLDNIDDKIDKLMGENNKQNS